MSKDDPMDADLVRGVILMVDLDGYLDQVRVYEACR